MKSSLVSRIEVAIIAGFLSFASLAVAQPAAGPLTIQGIDQFSIAGVRSRAMGGTAVGSASDVSALFSNPALLGRVSAPEVRVGGLFGATKREQTQAWVPMRPLPGISVLFEGLTRGVKVPDSNGVAGLPLSPWSTLQRQYDDIVPTWNKNSSNGQPLLLAAAMPLSISGLEIAAGVGIAQVIDLDHYYQNNNSMTPYLGQQRPDPFLITERNGIVHVKWYQYIRSREGAVYGITPGVSVPVLAGLRVGASASFLTGSSDDSEQRLERGNVNVLISDGKPSNFMVDTVYYVQSKAGTSTYKGTMLTLGLHFEQPRYSIGLTVKPPMTLTRTWDRNVASIDTTKKPFPIRIDSVTSRQYHESGTDDLEFPWAYTLGIVLRPTDKWVIAFDYELRHLANVKLTSGGSTSYPWVNDKGTIRLGAEYQMSKAVALRCGYHEDLQAFAPDGSAIVDQPARGGVYSIGTGIGLGNMMVDVAYEYAILKYEDLYQSNVNTNTRERHQFMIEFGYRF